MIRHLGIVGAGLHAEVPAGMGRVERVTRKVRKIGQRGRAPGCEAIAILAIAAE